MRFRARQAGLLLSVAVHVKAQTYIEADQEGGTPEAGSDNGNYGYGNGGNMRARVYTETGSGPNFTNEVARSENKFSIRDNYAIKNEVLKFDLYKPMQGDPNGVDKTHRLVMTAGAKYHIIFENDILPAANRITNFASVNWGNNASGPRFLNPPEPWSPYWSDERVYQFIFDPNHPDREYIYNYFESKRHQPAFELEIRPTGASANIFWGPINLLSATQLKSPIDPIGGVVPVDGTIKVREKFRVQSEITVSGMLIASAFFNPASPDTPAGILRVTLQAANEAELARCDYGTSDCLNTNSKVYFNLWNNPTANGVYRYVPKALRNAAGAAMPVTLVPGTDYYLSFARVAGNVTFVINIGQEPYPTYFDGGNFTPEGWA